MTVPWTFLLGFSCTYYRRFVVIKQDAFIAAWAFQRSNNYFGQMQYWTSEWKEKYDIHNITRGEDDIVKKKNKHNYSYKVVKNGKTIQKFRSSSKQNFYKRAGKIKWKNKPVKVHLRVSYGKQKTSSGRYEIFYNYGVCETSKDFWLALRAFCESD